jgi:hypothetical protein
MPVASVGDGIAIICGDNPIAADELPTRAQEAKAIVGYGGRTLLRLPASAIRGNPETILDQP